MKVRHLTGRRGSWSRLILAPMLAGLVMQWMGWHVSAHAADKSCLTGDDPSVAVDAGQIAALEPVIDATCPCGNFDGSSGKTSRDYRRCASAQIKEAVADNTLRSTCKSRLIKAYKATTCGYADDAGKVACIETSSKGKRRCKIDDEIECVTEPGRYDRLACPDALRCVDAADSSGDYRVDADDDAACIVPPSTTTSTTTTTLGPTTTSTTLAPTTTTTTTTSTTSTTTSTTTTATMPPMSALTIEFPGGGLGRVQDVANGIDCTDTCTEMVPTGTQVNLSVTSTDVPDGTFRAWRGPCTGIASPCTIEVDDDVSVDAVFLSSVVTIVLGDGPFAGTAPPDYTHSRSARLRLTNGGRARSLDGFQELRWTTSPEELRSGVESPPYCIAVVGTGPASVNFPAHIWDIFDVYTITLSLMDTSTGSQIASDSFNVFWSGDVDDPYPGYDNTPCP